MISNSEVQELARQWQLGDHIIEKDYVLGWVLWGIGQHEVLSKDWLLKGGSAIKKCFVDTHRYSQDLDFTLLPGGVSDPDVLFEMFTPILDEISASSGIDFSTRKHSFSLRPHGEACEGRIYYVGPRGNPGPTAVKLDISFSEDLMRPQVLRKIIHPYSDGLPGRDHVYSYSLEELFAEKVRALIERSRPRDLYDIIYLFRRADLNAEPDLIREVLEHKCAWKDVPIPSSHDFEGVISKDELGSSWEPMLRQSIGALPPMRDYWQELTAFFAWLNGEHYESKLEPIVEGEEWKAAPVEWQRGQKDRIEPIRYAAVNRLIVKLGYGSKFRLVEPYSLRRTQAGNILFYALKLPSRVLRSYRVDRIQSIEITHDPFDPTSAVEFTREGRIPVPLTQRKRRFSSRSSSRKYTIACALCSKRFYRDKYSTRINRHKSKGAQSQCPGRYGYLV